MPAIYSLAINHNWISFHFLSQQILEVPHLKMNNLFHDKRRRKKLQPCKVGGVLGLGRAEQFCTLSVHMLSCLYSTLGDSLT